MVLKQDQKTAYCKQCGKEKPLSDFSIYETAGRLYAYSFCRKCARERVKMLYYLKRKCPYISVINTDDEAENDDRQTDLFAVKNNTVFAKLIWFDRKWHNDFIPVIKCDSEAMCWKIISLLRDLSTSNLKMLNKEYLKGQKLVE